MRRLIGGEAAQRMRWIRNGGSHKRRGITAGHENGHAMRDGEPVGYAGIVIRRQRPGTASGVVLMALEDETGFVYVVV
jgi:hypothetical protein